MHNSIYKDIPIRYEEDIPIFSEPDNYIKNYEDIAETHLSHINNGNTNPFIIESVWNEIENSTAELIKKYSTVGEKILDVGVGLGRLLEKFPELNRYGVDISMNYLKTACTKNIECCMGKAETLPYCDNIFDIVICTDVLEHVLDLNKSVKEILRVLKPNGTLIIRVPYKEDLSGYLEKDYPYYYVHIRSFDEHSLLLLFTRIFSCKITEWNLTGNINTIDKLKNELPKNKFSKSLAYRYYFYILKYVSNKKFNSLFNPAEINFVVKKQ